MNVDYCSGQTLPNCRGWAKYKIAPSGGAPGDPPRTLSVAFPAWFNATVSSWDATTRAFAAAAAAARAVVAAPRPARAALARGQDVDVQRYPMNPSCPYPPG